MNERVRFWQDFQRGIFRFNELCELYGISRNTGYKFVRRVLREGLARAVHDRSRAPLSCPHRTDEALADALVEIRRIHRTWGPKKIIAYLERHLPGFAWPAPSTVGDILKRRVMVQPRRRKPRPGHPGRGNTAPIEPNAVWTADFKGHFRRVAVEALRLAIDSRRPATGLVHHSDRGGQYASGDYQQRLDRHGIVCSMSRSGNCYDNAMAESFFHSLKTEWVYHFTFDTRD